MNQEVQEAIVTIAYVQESPTKGGLRRFLIGAEREGDTLSERYLSFTTLDQFKASLCERHKVSGVPLAVKFRATGYFDYNLLWVGPVTQEATA